MPSMKNSVLIGALLFCCGNALLAQSGPVDTTIYEVAESLPLPLLARCQPAQHPNWPEDSIRQCAESQLLGIIAKNIQYPEEARQQNIEGTVVTTFVVERDGKISNLKTLKDIGGGCGPEAIRVLSALNEAGLRWRPALVAGKPVRMRQALPLRFRLQEALPYYIGSSGDTIYTNIDTQPGFRGGMDSLTSFVLNRLEYPVSYLDSCKTGIIEMALLIRKDGSIEVDNQLDYNNLGMDFQWQALQLVNRSKGLWIPAGYQNQPVTTTLPLRTLFKSERAGCASANERFDQAMLLADEGAAFSNQNEHEKAIEKWNQALSLHPNNTELLYYRGSALLSLNRRDEACADFNAVKSILGVTWFEPLRRLVCGW